MLLFPDFLRETHPFLVNGMPVNSLRMVYIYYPNFHLFNFSASNLINSASSQYFSQCAR